MAEKAKRLRLREPGAEGGRPNTHTKNSTIGFVSTLDCSYPQRVMKHFKNHTVVADAEALLIGVGERFGELQRVGLRCIEPHFGCDALPV